LWSFAAMPVEIPSKRSSRINRSGARSRNTK
jgi:hypothetical protein